MEKDITKKNKNKETSEEKKALLTEDAALGEIASDKIFEADPELAKELAEDRKIQEKAREYKALQEERKKQKRKRIMIILSAIAVTFLIVFLSVKLYQKRQEEINSAAEVKASAGQTLVYGEISSIVGNNITISLTEEDADAESTSVKEESGVKEGKTMGEGFGEGQRTGGPEMVEGQGTEGPEMTEGQDTEGTEMEEGQAGGNGRGMRSERGSGKGQKEMVSSGEGSSEEDKLSGAGQEEKAAETMQLQIPVGTEVITKLGTSTTFTSLSKGDVIAIALETGTEIIDKIWIVE